MKKNNIGVMLTFFMFILLSVNFVSCQKENVNENNNREENSIIQILKSNKWITHDSSYGEGSGDHAWVDVQSITLYFISDDTGIEYCINKDYDTDLGNSTSKYYFLFNYRVSGNMVIITDENSNTFSYYFRDGYLMSEKGGTIYEPSQMTSADYEFAKSLGPKTGSCGNNLKYSYDERKKEIKISGSGRMNDYSLTNQPWHNYYIEKVIVQEGCTYIGTHAFHKISQIDEIDLPNSLIEIGDYAFCDAMISEFMVPTELTKIGAYAFSDCEYLKEVNFYGCNSLEQISEYAFAYCPLKLGSFSVPKNIKKLGSFAFFSSSISSLSLNDKLEDIGNNVFGKVNTSKIDIPNSVKSIGSMAFIGSFSEIRIGTGLQTIGQVPFATSNSGKMYVNLGKPLSIQSGSYPYVILSTNGSNGEDGAKTWTLYVPKGSKSAYQNSVGWKSFKSIIEDSSLSNGNGNSDDNQDGSGNNDNQGGGGNDDNQGGNTSQENTSISYTINGRTFKTILVEGDNISPFYIMQTEIPYHGYMMIGDDYIDLDGIDQNSDGVIIKTCFRTFLDLVIKATGLPFRLPTTKEWEYAARGGKYDNGYIYSGSNSIDDVAWYKNNSENASHEIATKAPNELGLYDMSGNYAELCNDTKDKYNIDDSFCGGSWKDTAADCKVSSKKNGSTVGNIIGRNGAVAEKNAYDASFVGLRLVYSKE